MSRAATGCYSTGGPLSREDRVCGSFLFFFFFIVFHNSPRILRCVSRSLARLKGFIVAVVVQGQVGKPSFRGRVQWAPKSRTTGKGVLRALLWHPVSTDRPWMSQSSSTASLAIPNTG